ncbi:preprotein translocase subunit SecE [Candidatus Jorgensenbacteria bacterium GWA1_49_17]|uniref:Protein translocase subunit SecE n=1 Tax=Candidatus Jorgensenbacteria bacterium GWA1_49_17 TaxID=1798467 RepID=A0A1F6BSN1_9BACT|nr:MAG: Preprotein translocase SecE subunit [Parcubacteria group bacterium GW2011_GWC1_43_11]OGG39969.1 MAG: preprotein translocase subunit SecE [Candidatus Jorgensenbacteria bacterium GWA1_49_17]
MLSKIKLFLEESRRELKRVNWPSRQETTRYTLFVIGFSIVVAIFLGLLDFIFLQLLEGLII